MHVTMATIKKEKKNTENGKLKGHFSIKVITVLPSAMVCECNKFDITRVILNYHYTANK